MAATCDRVVRIDGVEVLGHSELAQVLPTTHIEAAQTFGSVWRLAEGNGMLDAPPRAALCELLELTPLA